MPLSDSQSLMMRRLLILALLTVVGLVVTAIFMALFPNGGTTPTMRVVTVIQDVMVFILPAVVLALIASRTAAGFLSLDGAPRLLPAVVALMALGASAPLQDWIIRWNESWRLPSAMARSMDAAEARARAATDLIMGGASVADLVLGLAIVAIFAALSEELFFRGALQRILAGNRRYSHTAVWVAALLFSLFHFQVYGLVPRLLLGAYFGYLVWWTRSLWVPVVVHAANNAVVVTGSWLSRRAGGGGDPLEGVADGNPWLVAASAALTALLVWTLYNVTHRRRASAG